MKKLINWVFTWLWLNLAWVTSAIYWRVLNKTTVKGQLPTTNGPLIVIAPHQLLTDPFLFGCTLDTWTTTFFKPSHVLWHCPAAEWLNNPILNWAARHLHCLPIHRRSAEGHEQIKAGLQAGNRILIFPSSGLMSKNSQRPAPTRLGKLIYEEQPLIIPVLVDGLPAWDGRRSQDATTAKEKRALIWERIFIGFSKQITITVQGPLNLTPEFSLENNQDTWKIIATKMLQAVTTN